MRELELGDKHSKSLMSNVLDMEDDYMLFPRDLSDKLPRSSSMPDPANKPCYPDQEIKHQIPPLYNSSQCSTLSCDHRNNNSNGIEKELREILKEIRVVTDKIRAEAEASTLENEWKFAAMVLDRVCLIAFTLFTVLLSAAVLLAAPHVIVWWAMNETQSITMNMELYIYN